MTGCAVCLAVAGPVFADQHASAVNPLSAITQITAGYHHNVALRRDGTLLAWGGNSAGQLQGPRDMANTPLLPISA